MTKVLILRVDKDRDLVVKSLSKLLQTNKSETLRRCIDFMEIIGNKDGNLQDLLDFNKMKKDGIDKENIFEKPLIDYMKPIEQIREEWGFVHVEE